MRPRRDPKGEIAQCAERLPSASQIVFLCSGNVVRSAYCDIYAQHLGCAVPVLSAATTYDTPALHEKTRSALVARKVSPQLIHAFGPTQLTDLSASDAIDRDAIVFTMTDEHMLRLQADKQLWSFLEGRAFHIPRVVGEVGQVPDPVFFGGWEEVFRSLTNYTSAIVEAVGRG